MFNLDSAAKPRQLDVFGCSRENLVLKMKALTRANPAKSARDGGFAAESKLKNLREHCNLLPNSMAPGNRTEGRSPLGEQIAYTEGVSFRRQLCW